MNAEQGKAAADMLATVWGGEFPATCAVLAACAQVIYFEFME